VAPPPGWTRSSAGRVHNYLEAPDAPEQSYRLLRAILSTAVTDKRIRENPCQIKGADKESSPERPETRWPHKRLTR
jgi:hypothetical protein